MEPDSQSEKVFRGYLLDLSASDLVRSWKAGDERAAEVLVDRYCIRLVAFITSRLGRRWHHEIDPKDVVQSAMGSFFHAAAESRIRVSQSVSAWHLLATIAKRKLLRPLDRQSAIKRGGDIARVTLTIQRADLKTGRAWAIKENFRHFWASRTRGWGQRFFARWYGWAIRSQLQPIKKVAKLL